MKGGGRLKGRMEGREDFERKDLRNWRENWRVRNKEKEDDICREWDR